MKFIVLIVGFSLLTRVKCQLEANVEDILYGEEEEEEDEEVAATTESSTTTTTTTSTTTTTTTSTTTTPAPPTTVAAPLSSASTNLTNANTSTTQNHTFVLQPANGTIFGSIITSIGTGTTERAQYVLGQVGNIWNNVGKLNITGIVDEALGIRNNYLARPIVTGILNVVFCNPFTFSDNNCRKRGKDGNSSNNITKPS